ncbi:S8 family serine peptidase [Ferruginibacter lapsinanis]|uniref:S8 family serine peptidase n=1 Tax=Ferruginibacter lapsinanis TaxID=563172 RepID=UPI001E4072C3|nr:S8 family serine peptidase [Ferruginibacter lapsinanis]UEG51134.1 S8 family serine peptidase [Ferruginibacter lapsinanis]
MKKHVLFILVVSFLSSYLMAQRPEQLVRFKSGVLPTNRNIAAGNFSKQAINRSLFNDRYFVLVQFESVPSQKIQNALKHAGVKLDRYISSNAYLASIPKDFNFTAAKSFSINTIAQIPPVYKIDDRLKKTDPVIDKENLRLVAVSYSASADAKMVQDELLKAGAQIIPTKISSAGVVFVEADKTVVDLMADLPFVTYISLQTIKDKPLNYNSVAAHGVGALNSAAGKNLNGKNVTIGVGDNADISTHIDFAGRLINRTPWIVTDHGTHTSGTAAGGGILDVKYKGMAPKATIISQFFSDIITTAPTYIADNNLVLTNNSYYSVDVGCPGEGEYDLLSSFVDEQTNSYKQLLHMIAAGNDGDFTCSPYPAFFGTVKSGWQSAKNVLTVGAINTQDYTIASFSGRGPVDDGRLKPEICAGGVNITSTISNNQYYTTEGTSMASPAVTGSLALAVERYRQLHSEANPSAALLKALACNTAEDLGNAGPDFTFGFGMLNVRRAVEAIDSNRYIIDSIANGENNVHTITLPQAAKQLKILLYWPDKEASLNTFSTLVNDLDLTVKDVSLAVHKPLVLNPSPLNVTDVAVEGVDHINNIEQIVIDDPAAGTYSINVNGFLLPFGKQDYVVTYEVTKPSVTVEYPFGGETLVPGDIENIRWDAYGTGNNNFTIEYSVNNGSSWIPIDTNVLASKRVYSWTVPSTITTTALIKVSAKNTALLDQSDFNFSVLGRPVVTTAKICEGAVELKWNTISGATSYDIMKLVGDSMQAVNNTTDTSFILTGLNKYTNYWLGVRAKNGTVAGRRSLSVSVIPNTGACSLSVFNNDIKVDSILEPSTARAFFANATDATRPVKINIKNNGSITIPGPFTVSYSIHDSLVATEVVNTSIPAGSTVNYTFATPYPTSSSFNYLFKAWTNNIADGIKNNDTAYKIVKLIANDPVTSLPLTENFESMAAADFITPEMAIGDNQRIDFSANTIRGRARTFVNTGFAYSGSKAITLDQAPYNEGTSTDSLIVNYNLSAQTANQLRYDFYYKNHGQTVNNLANKIWIRGSENDQWVEAYDLYLNQAALGGWKHGVININDVLSNALPPQTITATFQLKIGEEGQTSANSPSPETDIDDGYTFDDLNLKQATNDIAVTKINSPSPAECSLSSAETISIKIKNFNAITLNNLQASYQVNNGAIVTETIGAITANQILDYAFTQTVDLSAYTDYTIRVWVKYAGDDYPDNDSILDYKIHSSPLIASYPYLERFENNDGYFYTKGTNSSWQWGIPASTVINKAANGNKAWVTDLTGKYNNNETSYLYSPCFDLAGLQQPVLSFSHIYDIELNFDYTWVEYSTDGITWQKLGNAGNGTNWYDGIVNNVWRSSKKKWHVASIDLPVTGTVVRFRFVMSSDEGLTYEGVGVDDVHVFDKAQIYTGAPVSNITQNVNGNNWVHFTSGGKRVASVNSNGMNLGATTVKVYPYTGIVRNSNNQYYANRNIVIQSEHAPAGNVGVRFYFTNAEADSLISATGCSTCLKPIDAYELGVTKFSGNGANENGTLDDNFSGYYNLISPASTDIVPYDTGYYAEFAVNSFSEFWLSKDIITPQAISTCIGSTVTFKAAAYGTSFQWQEDNGTGYINVVNGPNYAGATTNTLQLINLPGSYAGYKYRCVVNGINGPENTLRFTSIWTGATSTDWFVATNWSCNAVPNQYTDVVIPAGLVRYPVVVANTSVKSIRVHLNATVTVNPGVSLDVNGK